MNIDSNSEYIKLYNMINTENRLYIETDKNMDDFWSNYLIFDSIVSKNKTTVFLENDIEHIKNKFVDYYKIYNIILYLLIVQDTIILDYQMVIKYFLKIVKIFI